MTFAAVCLGLALSAAFLGYAWYRVELVRAQRYETVSELRKELLASGHRFNATVEAQRALIARLTTLVDRYQARTRTLALKAGFMSQAELDADEAE